MSSLVDFSVSIDEEALAHRLDQLLDEKTMLEIQTVLAEMCNEYIPYVTGNLLNSQYITPEYVGYRADYAKEVYNRVDRPFNEEHHPKATHHWEQAMFEEHKDEFMERVRQILIRRANELYG
jgi:hypothetical protein